MRSFLILVIFFVCIAGPLFAADDNWSQFRGPNSSGVAPSGAKIPLEIGPKQNVTWVSDLIKGHSSPVVHGDRIYVTGIADKKLLTVAIDRTTGKQIWQAEAPYTSPERIHSTGSLAQASPATDGERVVSFFGSSGLICYDRDGKQLWYRPFGPFKNDFGAGSSPIIVGDRVILNLDHDSESVLLCLDKKTGETVWKVERPEFRRGYATPVIWEVDGKKQIVIAGTTRVVGYDVDSGTEIWNAGPIARLVTPTPVIGPGNILYVTGWTSGGDAGQPLDFPPFKVMIEKLDANKNGTLEVDEIGTTNMKDRFAQFDFNGDDHVTQAEYEKMMQVLGLARNKALAIRPGGKGDVSKSHVVWESVKGLPSLASPVVTAEHFYMIKEGGIITCLDVRTGQVAGTSRLAGGRYFGSPVLAGGKIYAISQQGELTVIEATKEMSQFHSADFGEEVCATPAIAGGQIFVRTAGHLYCFGKRD